MDNNRNYDTTLREFFSKHIESHMLLGNENFLKLHVPQYKAILESDFPDNLKRRKLMKRCSQWKGELAPSNRNTKLTIDDLQIAYELSGLPVDAILSKQEDSVIEYVDEEFINLLIELSSDLRYRNILSGLAFPIKYDPKSCTVMALAGITYTEKVVGRPIWISKSSLDKQIEQVKSFKKSGEA